jgi:hypothetical protein
MQFPQFSATVVAAILALPSIALAAPIAVAEPVNFVDLSANDTTIVPRSGSHYAHFCQDGNCGDTYKLVQNFGCGGTCYTGFSAHSIFLSQAGSSNPKPTASLYSSADCIGSYSSAGIWNGRTTYGLHWKQRGDLAECVFVLQLLREGTRPSAWVDLNEASVVDGFS